MITYFVWTTILSKSDGPEALLILSLFIGAMVSVIAIEYILDNDIKPLWIIPSIVTSFGFSIVIPLMIDIGLVSFILSIPVIVFKIISFIVKNTRSALERTYNNYIMKQ